MITKNNAKLFSPGDGIGELLSASRMNFLVRAARKQIVTRPPLTLAEQGDVIYLGVDETDAMSFYQGQIISDGAFSDCRYHVQFRGVVNSDAAASDLLELSDVAQASDVCLAYNLFDYREAYSDQTHVLADDREVVLYKVTDRAGCTRWLMNEGPWFCQDDTYSPTGSDKAASDAAAGELVLPRYTSAALSDYTGTASDQYHGWCRGQMFRDEAGEYNPWVNLNLPKTHMFFAVNVKISGGAAGNASDAATYRYDVFQIEYGSDLLLISDATPTKRRAAGRVDSDANMRVGSAYWDGSFAVKLYDPNEIPETSDCD